MLFAPGTWSRGDDRIAARAPDDVARARGPLLPRDLGRDVVRRLLGGPRRRHASSPPPTPPRRGGPARPRRGGTRRRRSSARRADGAWPSTTSCGAAAPTREASACTDGAGSRRPSRSRPASTISPAPKDHRAVRDVVAEREVVRDEEDAEAACLQVAEQVEHVDPRRGIEHADDLVGDEQLDVEQERARDEHSLELAAAQLMRVLAEARRRARAERRRAHARPSRPTRRGRSRGRSPSRA